MTKFVVIILVKISLQLISGTLGRPENYRLSEEQITRLRDIATQWKDSINLEKNPCDEFYNFACSDKEYPKSERMKKKDTKNRLIEIFSEKPELMTEAEEKYLKYSTVCEEFKPEDREEFIKWFKFDNSIGKWPAFEEKWNDTKFNLHLAIAEMNSYQYPVVFTHDVILYSNDITKAPLQIKKLDYFSIESHRYLLQIQFVKLGIRNAEEILSDAALFEKTYNEVAVSNKSFTDLKITYSELKDFIPELDWNKQMEIIYGGTPFDNYPVIIRSHEELKERFRAISKLNPRVIANYFFCVFVFITNNVEFYTGARPLFMPVIKQAVLKHQYDKNMKDILKGIYLTMYEVLRDNNGLVDRSAHYSSEQIITFLNDIFTLTSDEDLANEYKEISTNNNDCVKNYHRLQRLYKKRSVKPFFSNNAIAVETRNEIDRDIVSYIPNYIEEPSPFLFKAFLFPVISSVVTHAPNTTIFTSSLKECFAKQFTQEVTVEDLKGMLGDQLTLRAYRKWAKNFPDVVNEENKLIREYHLSAEELLVLPIAKLACKNAEAFNRVMTAFANSMEFQQIYECPVGSMLNVPEKCTFW